MKLSVAIPTSSLSDETTKLDKTRKVSILARACAIFGVETIYVYHEGSSVDGSLLVTLLKYLDTPQFLRKRLFPKINDLKFAGALHPMRIPSHALSSDPKGIKAGDAREGVVISVKGNRFVDVGIGKLVPYFGKKQVGQRLTIQFKKGHPDYSIKEITRNETGTYWGYLVKERASLQSLLAEWRGDIILTSRKGKLAAGKSISKNMESDSVLIAFGSPEKGIHEILGGGIRKIQNARTMNFFANQTTETVRLEEALLGTLSIINAYNSQRQTV